MKETLNAVSMINLLNSKVLKWSEFGQRVADPTVSMVTVIAFVIDEGLYHHDAQLATMINSCTFNNSFRELVKSTIASSVKSFQLVIAELTDKVRASEQENNKLSKGDVQYV